MLRTMKIATSPAHSLSRTVKTLFMGTWAERFTPKALLQNPRFSSMIKMVRRRGIAILRNIR